MTKARDKREDVKASLSRYYGEQTLPPWALRRVMRLHISSPALVWVQSWQSYSNIHISFLRYSLKNTKFFKISRTPIELYVIGDFVGSFDYNCSLIISLSGRFKSFVLRNHTHHFDLFSIQKNLYYHFTLIFH